MNASLHIIFATMIFVFKAFTAHSQPILIQDAQELIEIFSHHIVLIMTSAGDANAGILLDNSTVLTKHLLEYDEYTDTEPLIIRADQNIDLYTSSKTDLADAISTWALSAPQQKRFAHLKEEDPKALLPSNVCLLSLTEPFDAVPPLYEDFVKADTESIQTVGFFLQLQDIDPPEIAPLAPGSLCTMGIALRPFWFTTPYDPSQLSSPIEIACPTTIQNPKTILSGAPCFIQDIYYKWRIFGLNIGEVHYFTPDSATSIMGELRESNRFVVQSTTTLYKPRPKKAHTPLKNAHFGNIFKSSLAPKDDINRHPHLRLLKNTDRNAPRNRCSEERAHHTPDSNIVKGRRAQIENPDKIDHPYLYVRPIETRLFLDRLVHLSIQ